MQSTKSFGSITLTGKVPAVQSLSSAFLHQSKVVKASQQHSRATAKTIRLSSPATSPFAFHLRNAPTHLPKPLPDFWENLSFEDPVKPEPLTLKHPELSPSGFPSFGEDDSDIFLGMQFSSSPTSPLSYLEDSSSLNSPSSESFESDAQDPIEEFLCPTFTSINSISYAPKSIGFLLNEPRFTAGNATEDSYLNATRSLLAQSGPQVLLSLDSSGLGMVHYASAFGFTKVLKEFQQHSDGSCFNLIDQAGQTCLHHSVKSNRLDTTVFLVNQKLQIDSLSSLGESPLQLACENGKTEILTALLSKIPKSKLDQRNEDGRTILHYAASLGYHQAVEMLVRLGANISLKDCSGAIPLSLAIMNGHHSFIPFLIKDLLLDSVDMLGRTPLHWAAAVGNLEAAKILLKNGAKLEQRDRKGRTPFLLASFNNQANLISFLRLKKASKDVEDYEGRRALD